MWHGTELARWASYGAPGGQEAAPGHLLFLVACFGIGMVIARRTFTTRLEVES